ncbi:MAG: class I SAM-dependent methyltransferase [Bdellovibrionaceae bacterium]|nr:class I SAM-dependent methyltransferase [Pseudobdellovibrionaceae bacterium]MBX3033372.1 class I SAM-dependent methyltransferase [Pseudobdellovibrionaceae bacterium]
MSTLRPTERFSDRVENYKKFRPGYPAGVITSLQDLFPADRRPLRIADVGAGTGIFTRLLLEAGHEVWAVEPNDEMRFVAEKDLASYPSFHALKGSSERMGLPAAEFDLVTAAQAFHWFDPRATRREFRRLLKPDGRAAILWNNRQVLSPVEIAYENFLTDTSKEYAQVRAQTKKAIVNLQTFFTEGSLRHQSFENHQDFDWESFWGRYLSSSYAAKPGSPQAQDALGLLRAIFQRYSENDLVRIHYVTDLYTGRC